MTTTSVDDAIILPQSQGTGLGGEESVIDAAINGVLNRYVGGEYVSSTYSTGLAFQNHNASNDTVEVGPGIVFIKDNSTSTSGERGSGGNPQAESSTTSGYDTELPEGHTYAVLLPTATEISVSDSTLNEVYIDIPDVTANNGVNIEHDGSSTASPSSTSLKIGETNPDDASADTRANDDASPTFDSLTVNGTTDTDALNADNGVIKVANGEVFAGHPDFATVQDAINYASTNNIGVVAVPDGTYGPITVKSGLTIKGSEVYRDVDSISPTFDGGTSNHAVTLMSDTSVIGIGAKTTSGGGSSFNAFYDDPNGGDGSQITGCAVLSSDNHGIEIHNRRVSVTNNVFQVTDGDSIFISSNASSVLVDSNMEIRSITNNGSTVTIGDNV